VRAVLICASHPTEHSAEGSQTVYGSAAGTRRSVVADPDVGLPATYRGDCGLARDDGGLRRKLEFDREARLPVFEGGVAGVSASDRSEIEIG
jgi:hypothetical protein